MCRHRVPYLIPENPDEAGFANARFARQHDDLSHALGGALPAVHQQADLLLPPHQACQASRRRHVEPGLRSALVQDPVHHEGLGQAFEVLRPEGLTHKIAVDQVRGGLADHHRIGGRQSLQAGGDVRGLAEG